MTLIKSGILNFSKTVLVFPLVKSFTNFSHLSIQTKALTSEQIEFEYKVFVSNDYTTKNYFFQQSGDNLMNLINAINSVIWGFPMLSLFLFTGLYFTFKSRFFQIRKLPYIFKSTVFKMFKKDESKDGISEFGAFCSVLASCIGTGNIVGVATAIYEGGAGSIFWMWVSAFISLMTAYSENYLGIIYRRRDKHGKLRGGAFQYIEKGLNMRGLSKVYAIFCLFSTLGMGNMAQANSISSSLNTVFSLSPILIGLSVIVLCFLIIKGGVKRISKISEIIVPFMSLAYLSLSFSVLIIFKDRIIPAFKLIFKEAFSIKAVSGYGISKAMRFGISRGVFSNEAGLGSSTIIHSETENTSPENQGMWAMFEVFCDTIFLCTVMALVILVSGAFTNGGSLFGAELSVASYGILGEVGKKGIAVLTAVFSFASLTGCSFYGEKSAEYLFGTKIIKPYKIFYLILAFIGSVASPKIIWTVADIFNGLMAIPNLFALNCLKKEVEFSE